MPKESEKKPAEEGRCVPEALKTRAQWLVWKFEQKAGQEKPAKIPYYVAGMRRVGKQGSDKDRQRLVAYERAVQTCARGGFEGIGFAFLPGDGLIGIDLDRVIDPETGEIAERARNIIEACASFTEFSPSGKGVHIYVLGRTKTFKSNAAGVEVFCESQFFTVTGRQIPGAPSTLNAISDQVLHKLELTVKGASKAGKPARAAAAPDKRSEVESALAVLSPDTGYAPWIQLGMAVHAELGEAGLAVWDHWSSRGQKYPGAAVLEQHWRSFKPGAITGATLFKFAREAGWRGIERKVSPAVERAPNLPDGGDTTADGQEDMEPLPPAYSEHQLALEFTARQRGRLLYVAEHGKWYIWNLLQWQADLTLHWFDHARAVAKAAAARALVDSSLKPTDRTWIARMIASAKTVAAIATLARADRAHAVAADVWDPDPMLVNTPGGVVDLKTATMVTRRPELLMSKLSRGKPGGRCPTWEWFLNYVTDGNRELVAFLQRWVGYCLTGDTREHKVLFLWGLGANGKSTFANAIMDVFGDYAITAPAETFVESYTERHPTDLAMLQGARLVVVQEVEDGARWAAARIKALTGGDPIRARFMRQDFFEFTPRFKLLFCGNCKPAFRTVDEAIRRRFCLVPFTQTIPPAERDLALPEKLRAERDGILTWALDGCLEWQEKGLAPPAAVRAATDAYMADEDLLRTWLEDCCDQDKRAFAAIADLHASYQVWATRAGEKFFGMKRFSQILEDHGYERARSSDNRVRGFRGLRPRQIQGRLEAVA